jgi:hypothetical protein
MKEELREHGLVSIGDELLLYDHGEGHGLDGGKWWWVVGWKGRWRCKGGGRQRWRAKAPVELAYMQLSKE